MQEALPAGQIKVRMRGGEPEPHLQRVMMKLSGPNKMITNGEPAAAASAGTSGQVCKFFAQQGHLLFLYRSQSVALNYYHPYNDDFKKKGRRLAPGWCRWGDNCFHVHSEGGRARGFMPSVSHGLELPMRTCAESFDRALGQGAPAGGNAGGGDLTCGAGAGPFKLIAASARSSKDCSLARLMQQDAAQQAVVIKHANCIELGAQESCKFFAREGWCKWGDACYYLHSDLSRIQVSLKGERCLVFLDSDVGSLEVRCRKGCHFRQLESKMS